MTDTMLANELTARVIAATRAGRSAPQIAAAEGISERTVNRIRVRAGIGRPSPAKQLTDAEFITAAKMLDDGASRCEVARTLGHSPTTIARRFPGRCWTRAQTAELSSIRMRYRGVL
jgi:DNA-binding CsgD family transcriptional regulator